MEEKFVRVRTLTPASRAYQRMRPTLALGRAWRRLLALFPIIAPIFILTVWWFEVPGLTTPFDVHPLVFAAGLAIFWFVVSEFLSYLALLMRFFLHRFVQGLLGAALGAVSLLSFAALFINVAMAGWEIGDWDSLPALALFAAVCAYAAYISWCFFVAGLAPMLVNATNYSVARGFIPAWRNLFALRRFHFGEPLYLQRFAKRVGVGRFYLFASQVLTAPIVVMLYLFLIDVPSRAAGADPYEIVFFAEEASLYGADFLLGEGYIDEYAWIEIASIAGFVVALIVFAFLARAFFNAARRRMTISFAGARADDTRPPVTFLRSFSDDQGALRREPLSILDRVLLTFEEVSTLDEIITFQASLYGPVVAVGKPGEAVPPYGAARMYAPTDNWQDIVARLVQSSHLIVLALHETEGVQWERKLISSSGQQDRTLYLIAPQVEGATRDALAAQAIADLGGASAPATGQAPVAIYSVNGEVVVLTAKRPSRIDYKMAVTTALMQKFGYPSDVWPLPKLNFAAQ